MEMTFEDRTGKFSKSRFYRAGIKDDGLTDHAASEVFQNF